MQTVSIGLSAWIIQDGNYGDFRVGELARFAVEFYPHVIRPAEKPAPALERRWGSMYRACGQVIYANPEVWVVDFGIKAYQDHAPPAFAREGSWVDGEVYLGVDPFFYFESLYALPGMPALQYEFRIKEILLETTPWLETKDGQGRTTWTRDENRKAFIPVAQTNAWIDDEQMAHYVLNCEVVSPP